MWANKCETIALCIATVFWYQAEILSYLDVTIPTRTKVFNFLAFKLTLRTN